MLNLAEYMASIFIRLADLLALWQNYWTSSWGEQKPTNITGGAQPCTSFVNKFAESWPVDLFLRYIIGLSEATFWRNSWYLHYCTVQHRYSPKAVHLSLGLAEYTLVACLLQHIISSSNTLSVQTIMPTKRRFHPYNPQPVVDKWTLIQALLVPCTSCSCHPRVLLIASNDQRVIYRVNRSLG